MDAERLLRLRGLAKRWISRRARLLHHVYTWIRIVGESTYVLHDYDSHAFKLAGSHRDQNQTTPVAPQGQAYQRSTTPQGMEHERLDDFLRLRPQASDSDLEIEEPKELEAGRRDIHLEDSRQFGDTLMPMIYGIPETWLSLVSQITRLANLMEMLKSSSSPDRHEMSASLQRRASLLEDMVCSFSAFPERNSEEDDGDSEVAGDGHGNTSNADADPKVHLLRALNSALEIFFYRRIRNVHPRILQGFVGEVVKSLRRFDELSTDCHILGAGSFWVVFIAGCEAMNSSNRRFFEQWTDRGYALSGIHGFQLAKDVMNQVWQKRDGMLAESRRGENPRARPTATNPPKVMRPALTQCSWVDVSRELNVWVLLC